MTPDPGLPRLRAEALRTLYRQLPNSSLAALIVIVFMAITAWSYSPHGIIIVWVEIQAATQVARAALYLAYRRKPHSDSEMALWGWLHVIYMWIAGLCWAACAFWFMHPEQPVSIALTMCGLYGLTGGAVAGNAYNPYAIYGFIFLIFGGALVRLIGIGGSGYITLGIASLAYTAILFLFCRVQAREILESLRIRFENVALVEQLRIQKNEEEAARHRAEQANLAKSQFLSAASHDLRQPLYALSLFSASLGALRLNAKARQTVGRIQDSIESMNSLFEGLLDLSRLEAGVVHATMAPVEVEALFDRLHRYFHAQVEQKGLRFQLVPTQAWVVADALRLEQVMANLIANAVRYTSEGGIVVGVRRVSDGRLRLCVYDSGIGVASADQSRIFEEFVQIGNRERSREKGLGLGLSIARRTTALMGTQLRLGSVPGKGSVFYLDLDVADAPKEAVPRLEEDLPDTARPPNAPRLHLLFVDDDDDIREAFAELMTQWGIRHRCLSGAAEAMALFAAGEVFDLVISDYRLGEDADGFAVLNAARTQVTPCPRCVLVTGDMAPQLIQDAKAQDIVLLHKPLQLAKLHALISACATLDRTA